MCGSQSEGTDYTTNKPTGLDKIMILYITIPAIRMFKNPAYTCVPEVKVNTSAFNSRADSGSKTSYTHGLN